jgi:hypothetical protein
MQNRSSPNYASAEGTTDKTKHWKKGRGNGHSDVRGASYCLVQQSQHTEKETQCEQHSGSHGQCTKIY